jgi:hypothetical protein
MTVARTDTHTATLLPDGRVLVAGGPGAVAELYEPETGIWTRTGRMIEGEGGHSATLLGNGRVLVAGGIGAGDVGRATAQLYDPTSGTWTATAPLREARISGIAVLLEDGRVLVTGGSAQNRSGPRSSAELYDPGS